MIRTTIFAMICVVLLAGCADSSAQNAVCAQQAQENLHWGYYPGYGCGPVPPAQTKFS
ncbi:MAG TPA: hypothetical protein VGF92_15195 [Stellaceae bacterium]|jgi:hypothetical protein